MSVQGTLTAISLGTEEIDLEATKMQLPNGATISPGLVREWFNARRANVKPWSSFVSTSHFKSPLTLTRWSSRVARNIEHFQSNYFFVSILLVLYCLLTSPLLVLVLLSQAGACYLLTLRNVESPLRVGGKSVPLTHQYLAVACVFGPVFWLAGAGSLLLWVVAGSAVVVLGHASFYAIEAVLGDDSAPFDMEEVCVA